MKEYTIRRVESSYGLVLSIKIVAARSGSLRTNKKLAILS